MSKRERRGEEGEREREFSFIGKDRDRIVPNVKEKL